MKPGTELFELIKSLNKGEKRYFKRHSLIKSKSDKNYLRLFDSIEKQAAYDEKKLRFQYKNHAFARQFPVAKSYLYERILKALDSSHTSLFEEVRNYLHYAEILFAKGLFAQSIKILAKAKRSAIEYDKYFFVSEVLYWENEIALKKYDLDRMKEIIIEDNHYLTLLKNIQMYRLLLYTVNVGDLGRKGEGVSGRNMERINKVIRHPAMQSESKALTFTAKQYYYDTLYFYWHAKGNNEKAMHASQKMLELFDRYPEKIISSFYTYMAKFNNLLVLHSEERNHQEVSRLLSKLKADNSLIRNPADKAWGFSVYSSHLLNLYQQTGQFGEAVKIIPTLKNEFSKYEGLLNPHEKILYYYNFSLIYFAVKDFNSCIKYLNLIRNDVSPNTRMYVDRFLTLFYIVVHYEAGHLDLLPHLTNSAYRYLDKHYGLSEIEKVMLQLFKTELPKAKSRIQINGLFRRLKGEMLLFSDSLTEKYNFEYFDFISWVDSKIQNRSFAEVVREKAKLRNF